MKNEVQNLDDKELKSFGESPYKKEQNKYQIDSREKIDAFHIENT